MPYEKMQNIFKKKQIIGGKSINNFASPQQPRARGG
jgi:hypothetical protein